MYEHSIFNKKYVFDKTENINNIRFIIIILKISWTVPLKRNILRGILFLNKINKNIDKLEKLQALEMVLGRNPPP